MNVAIAKKNDIFFAQYHIGAFGVDVSKPDESSSIERENSIDYLSVDYTVCGEIIEASKYEIDI